MATEAMPYDTYNEAEEEDTQEGFLLLPASPPDLESTEMFPEISDVTMVRNTVEPAQRQGKSFAAVAATTASVACTVPAKADTASNASSVPSRPMTDTETDKQAAVAPREVKKMQEAPEREDQGDDEAVAAPADADAFQVAASQRKKKDNRQDKGAKAKQEEERPQQGKKLKTQNAFEMLADEAGDGDHVAAGDDGDGADGDAESSLDSNTGGNKPLSKSRGRRKSDTDKKRASNEAATSVPWVLPVALLILLGALYYARFGR